MNPYIDRITGNSLQERGPIANAIKSAFGGSPDAAPDDEGAPVEAGGGEGALPPEPPEGGGDEGMPGDGAEGLEPWQVHMLEQIHERFVNERVQGFASPHGDTYPPVPREEAEERWLKVRPRFLDVIQNDPAVRERFDPANQNQGAARDELARHAQLCPHCGQPMPQGREMPPEELAPEAGEGAPEAPEAAPEPAPEPAEAAPAPDEQPEPEPEPERGPRLPESARRMARRKLDDE